MTVDIQKLRSMCGVAFKDTVDLLRLAEAVPALLDEVESLKASLIEKSTEANRLREERDHYREKRAEAEHELANAQQATEHDRNTCMDCGRPLVPCTCREGCPGGKCPVVDCTQPLQHELANANESLAAEREFSTRLVRVVEAACTWSENTEGDLVYATQVALEQACAEYSAWHATQKRVDEPDGTVEPAIEPLATRLSALLPLAPGHGGSLTAIAERVDLLTEMLRELARDGGGR